MNICKCLNDNLDNHEYVYNFKNVLLNVYFEPESISEDLLELIKNDILILLNDIWVDKSYVLCKQNKRDDVFLVLEGWNSLKTLLDDTNFGYDATDELCQLILDSYTSIVIGYMYETMSKLYPNLMSHIHMEISNKSKMQVEIFNDVTNDWKTYPGKWQTWS